MTKLLGGIEIMHVKHPVECLVHSDALQMVARATPNYAVLATSHHCHIQLHRSYSVFLESLNPFCSPVSPSFLMRLGKLVILFILSSHGCREMYYYL